MERCYVVLKSCPNEDAPEHEVTTLLCVTSTLPLAERAIANYCRDGFGEEGKSLVCQVIPTCSDVRTYWVEKHFGAKTATTFTVTEEAIDDEWALM